MRRKMYTWHRWLGIFVSLPLVLWLLSGIVMLLPRGWSDVDPQPVAGPPDFASAVVSPAKAVSAVAEGLPVGTRVVGCRLLPIHRDIVYEVRVEGGPKQHVDARTGQRFELRAEAAAALVRSRYPNGAEVLEVERIESNSALYPSGPVPAFRVTFADDASVWFYVDAHTGDVTRSSRASRIRAGIESLHTFEPVALLIPSRRFQKVLLIFFGAVGLAVALSGGYLALPLWRRRRRRAPTEPGPDTRRS